MVISNKKVINLIKLSKNVGEPIHFSSKCGDFIGFILKYLENISFCTLKNTIKNVYDPKRCFIIPLCKKCLKFLPRNMSCLNNDLPKNKNIYSLF
jgi:hypothetical protein